MLVFSKDRKGVHGTDSIEAQIENETDYGELVGLWMDHPECRIKIESQMSCVVEKEDYYERLGVWLDFVPAYSVPAQQIRVRMSILNARQLKNIVEYQKLVKRLDKTPVRKQQIEIEVRICELINMVNWFDMNRRAPTFFMDYLINLEEIPDYAKEAFLKKVSEIVLR